jgi:signal transduction histidine kinase
MELDETGGIWSTWSANPRSLPSSQAALRPPGPLRTGREGFPSPSSSPSNASLEETRFRNGKTLTIEAQEAERARIARDLHDDIGQRLTLSGIALEQLKRSPRDSKNAAHASIAELQQHFQEISATIHNLSHELHSATLEHLGLVAAIRGSYRELAECQKAEIHFQHEGVPQAVPREISLCLFRVLQEALQNAVKHSGVRQFGVELRGTPNSLNLTIRGGGVGFDREAASRSPGLGLTSMLERIKLVHGELFIESQFEHGTTVNARVPVHSNGNPAPLAA